MGFLIDTAIWIAIERGRIGAADIHAVTRQSPVYVSPVNIAEIRFGIGLMRDPAQKLKAGALFRRMARKPLLRITGETADVFGRLAADLTIAGRGVEFRVQDLWLAAQAVQQGFGLLTFNGKDFRDIPDLNLVVLPSA